MTIETASGFRIGSPTITGASGYERFGINLQILKEYYEPAIRDLLNSRTPLLKMMKKMERFELKGQYGKIALRVGRNDGIGFISEGAALPDPMRQQYDAATYGLVYQYGRIKFSGPSVDATDSPRGSFLEVMDSETTGLVQDIARDTNRALYGDGSGRLAQARGPAGGGASTTATVLNPGGFANPGPGTQYLREGQRVAIVKYVIATKVATISAVRTITAVDRSANTITFDSSYTWPLEVATEVHYLVYASNLTTTALGDTGWMKEIWGLAALISDDNPARDSLTSTLYLGQLNRSNVPVWRSIKIHNNGNPIQFYPLYLQSALDALSQASDGNIAAFIMSYTLRLTYLDSLQPARQYSNTMSFDGGYESLSYSGRPCIPDRDCTHGRIYCIDPDVMGWAIGKDIQFADLDGAVLSRMPNEDAYQATLLRYAQAITDAPNRQAVITDLKDV
jgi:hypothetical protein